MIQIIGVDPGPVTGICCLWPVEPGALIARVYQVNAAAAVELLEWRVLTGALAKRKTVIAHERFDIRPGTARSAHPAAGQAARDLNGAIRELAGDGVRVVEARPSDVMPWASNDRLRAAELWAPTTGLPHARDAARMAVHAAVRRCGWPDPLEVPIWRPGELREAITRLSIPGELGGGELATGHTDAVIRFGTVPILAGEADV